MHCWSSIFRAYSVRTVGRYPIAYGCFLATNPVCGPYRRHRDEGVAARVVAPAASQDVASKAPSGSVWSHRAAIGGVQKQLPLLLPLDAVAEDDSS